jgi:hypothetical protein
MSPTSSESHLTPERNSVQHLSNLGRFCMCVAGAMTVASDLIRAGIEAGMRQPYMHDLTETAELAGTAAIGVLAITGLEHVLNHKRQ